jgi:hypothetical protein
MKKHTLIALIAMVLVAIGISSRLIDHQPNFVAIGGLAIAIGFYSKSKLGWLIPLGAMFASDLVIGFYAVGVMASVYAGYALMWGFGRLASLHKKRSAMFTYTLLGATAYFLLTNAAVWAFTDLYPAGFSGLAMSYTMAIPFFKWSLAGDLSYLAVFVAVIETARVFAAKSEEKPAISLV